MSPVALSSLEFKSLNSNAKKKKKEKEKFLRLFKAELTHLYENYFLPNCNP